MRMYNREFLEKLYKVHGDKYSCEDTDKTSIKSLYKINCKKHGDFWIRGNLLLRGFGCKGCEEDLLKENKHVKNTTADAININILRTVLNLKNQGLDLSEFRIDYLYNKGKINCKKHGDFWITGKKLINGYGCPKCDSLSKYYSKLLKNCVQPEDHKIILYKGSQILIDNDIFYFLMDHKCYISNNYVLFYKNSKTIRLHRYIMDCPEDMVVDHKNGNTLDNRRCNLRVCSNNQNIWNSSKTTAMSGIRGVYKSYRNDKLKWRAGITFEGKYYNLGLFETKEEAGLAYDLKAVELRGEFAKLNFPELRDMSLHQIKKRKN